eukprot:gnl/TRDRNA2_/TRDRNA2_36266_c0_seq2.p1 gnl/TRDRNA2_/TRDRNA2_36266_c0~~gnl/TRDRNA2_/TRDRNA2_36266_c0_seq2.p1  ORF type:complete len:349 (+),score=71.45 gnl/TRDRNA2_/TRDRNA2_36266_c0_seq2:56-1102(+)
MEDDDFFDEEGVAGAFGTAELASLGAAALLTVALITIATLVLRGRDSKPAGAASGCSRTDNASPAHTPGLRRRPGRHAEGDDRSSMAKGAADIDALGEAKFKAELEREEAEAVDEGSRLALHGAPCNGETPSPNREVYDATMDANRRLRILRHPYPVYRVRYRGGVHLCRGPGVEYGRAGEVLRFGENFAATAEFDGADGRLYLRLADRRGWAYDDAGVLPDDPSLELVWDPSTSTVVTCPPPLDFPPCEESCPLTPWRTPLQLLRLESEDPAALLSPRTRLHAQYRGLVALVTPPKKLKKECEHDLLANHAAGGDGEAIATGNRKGAEKPKVKAKAKPKAKTKVCAY